MKRLALIIFSLSLGVLTYFCYPAVLSSFFKISGKIEVAPRLQKNALKPNTTCYVIAKNSSGIPVAIKKIVNPDFPLNFNITKKDLIIPDAWKKPMHIEVYLNQHGEIGKLKAGDMFVKSTQEVKMFDKKINLTVSKMMGVPTVRPGVNYYDKSRWLFTTAAR